MKEEPYLTPLDRQLLARSLLISVTLGALLLFVAALTDERDTTWPDRAARFAALWPIVSAVAVAMVKLQLQRRGELLALQLTGASPWRALRAALVGNTVVAMMSSIVLCVVPLKALFPAATQRPQFAAVSSGILHPSRGVFLDHPQATPTWFSAEEIASFNAPRVMVVLAVLWLGVVGAFWTISPCNKASRVALMAVVGVVAVFSFHAVAAGFSPVFLLSAPLILSAHSLMLIQSERSFV